MVVFGRREKMLKTIKIRQKKQVMRQKGHIVAVIMNL